MTRSSAVKALLGMTAVCTFAGWASPVWSGGPAKTLCHPDEKVYFSCSIRSKVLSLCASTDVSRNGGYLKYRFGALGKPPELSYPKDSLHPADSFTLYHSEYAKGSSTQLNFRLNDYDYTLYHESNVFDINWSGIVIDRSGKHVAHLQCTKKSISTDEFANLGALAIPTAEFREYSWLNRGH